MWIGSWINQTQNKVFSTEVLANQEDVIITSEDAVFEEIARFQLEWLEPETGTWTGDIDGEEYTLDAVFQRDAVAGVLKSASGVERVVMGCAYNLVIDIHGSGGGEIELESFVLLARYLNNTDAVAAASDFAFDPFSIPIGLKGESEDDQPIDPGSTSCESQRQACIATESGKYHAAVQNCKLPHVGAIISGGSAGAVGIGGGYKIIVKKIGKKFIPIYGIASTIAGGIVGGYVGQTSAEMVCLKRAKNTHLANVNGCWNDYFACVDSGND